MNVELLRQVLNEFKNDLTIARVTCGIRGEATDVIIDRDMVFNLYKDHLCVTYKKICDLYLCKIHIPCEEINCASLEVYLDTENT